MYTITGIIIANLLDTIISRYPQKITEPETDCKYEYMSMSSKAIKNSSD